MPDGLQLQSKPPLPLPEGQLPLSSKPSSFLPGQLQSPLLNLFISLDYANRKKNARKGLFSWECSEHHCLRSGSLRCGPQRSSVPTGHSLLGLACPPKPAFLNTVSNFTCVLKSVICKCDYILCILYCVCVHSIHCIYTK